MRKLCFIILIIVIPLLVFACKSKEPAFEEVNSSLPQSTDANNLMPQVMDYYIIHGDQISTVLSEGAKSIVTSSTGSTSANEVIDATKLFFDCLDKRGALVKKVYVSKEDVLSAAIISITNKNQMTDPEVLAKCVAEAVKPPTFFIGGSNYGLYKGAYKIKTNYNTFYVVYATTSLESCERFCGILEGCSQSKSKCYS